MASAGRRDRFERCSWRWNAAGFATLNLDYASRRKPLEMLAEDIDPAIEQLRRSRRRLLPFRLSFHGRACWRASTRQVSAETTGPRRDARHAERRQRNRRPAEEYSPSIAPSSDRPGSSSARSGTRNRSAVSAGRLSRRHHRRKPVDRSDHRRRFCRSRMTAGCRWKTPGSTAWPTTSWSATAHPWLVRNRVAIAQTIAFADGRVRRLL